MGKYKQANRPLTIATPLGEDAVLVEKLTGHEAISNLFAFQLDLLAEQPIVYDRMLGQKATVTLAAPGCPQRYFSGMIAKLSQVGTAVAADGRTTFYRYRAELTPRFWLWTKRVQSRIFQHISVPDILRSVLHGLDVTFELYSDYKPRDYCVQYRESDFAFASRLMEEDGIYYFFHHTKDGHQLAISDSPLSFANLPEMSRLIYEEVRGGMRAETRIFAWEKTQEITAEKVTLWDDCFELPGKHLEADQGIADAVQVGTIQHKLRVDANDNLEIYDYPGRYAQRYDGVNQGGGDQSGDLSNIFKDNVRTVKIRMEQEAVQTVEIHGQSNCGHLTPGWKLELTRHFDGDGAYLLARVEHDASLAGGYITGDDAGLLYQNRLTCLPAALPFRPLRRTPRPRIEGAQTATVVGISGEKIFCDKYGRVKVQFPWDRQGRYNADSSCWLRVGQAWASDGFGAVHIPRIGDEVIVGFLEGDPDQPIILCSVYNADQMPPLKLPDHRMHTGFRSRSVSSSKGGLNYHEIRFDDTPDQEVLHLHSENHMHHGAEVSMTNFIGFGHPSSGRGGGTMTVRATPPGSSGSGGGAPPTTVAPPTTAAPPTTEGPTTTEAPTKKAKGKGGGPAWFQAVNGDGRETTWGNNFEWVIGDNVELIMGENIEVVLGLNAEVAVGLNFEAFFGMNVEVIVGPNIEVFKGPTLEWVYGNYYEKINGDYLEIVNGEFVEVINNGDLLTVVNGWIAEWIKNSKTARISQTDLDDAHELMNQWGGPAALMHTASGAGLLAAGAQDAINEILSVAATNPLTHEEIYKVDTNVIYSDINILSKNGDIYISALGAGKKIVLQAASIELRGNTVAAYFQNGVANPGFQADPAPCAAELARGTEVATELELDCIKELVEVVEKETSSALTYTMSALAWGITIAIVVVFVLAMVGLTIGAAVTAQYSEE